MRLKFKDKWLTSKEKSAIRKALLKEKAEYDDHTYHVNVNDMKIKAEWHDGIYYVEVYY
ncbi:hypothetical protein AXJ14_gp199 [Geobacillus virus E3]|uniref:hypothetical protein n=1 Tax=Geobacillus virus E3 TaxID=1572712 RepID=UPI000671AC48|nr:hypothetical protein AXJ14_gp199 [Geobacillus virus E3]AJA41518.1 hypothetical protein E3_0199 [Geobacillus virus E3]